MWTETTSRFQGWQRGGSVPRDGQEDLPEHPGRAPRPERGGIGGAAQAFSAGPQQPLQRPAGQQRQLRLLVERGEARFIRKESPAILQILL